MRYTPTKKQLFVNIVFVAAFPRFGNIYLPWVDTLTEIQLKEVTCETHHRVPSEWDDEVKYDGYIFRDADGTTWANQYPRAAYGQLDDSENWRIRPTSLDDDTLFLVFEDAEKLLERVLRGVQNEDLAEEERQSLQKHYDEIVAKIESEFPYAVQNTAREWKKTDGTVVAYEDIRKIKIVPKDEAVVA